jgi:hypothetical protein
MSNAWETTSSDVANVLAKHGIDLEEEVLEEVTDFQLDHELVEASALYGATMDEQIVFAYEEIEAQLKKVGVIQ